MAQPSLPLNNKAKSALKGVGQRMRDDAVVGDDGPSEGLLAHIGVLLSKQELVKIRFGFGDGPDRKAIGQALAESLHAELVSVVGRTCLLYKPNPELPKAQRVFQ